MLGERRGNPADRLYTPTVKRGAATEAEQRLHKRAMACCSNGN